MLPFSPCPGWVGTAVVGSFITVSPWWFCSRPWPAFAIATSWAANAGDSSRLPFSTGAFGLLAAAWFGHRLMRALHWGRLTLPDSTGDFSVGCALAHREALAFFIVCRGQVVVGFV